MLIPIDNDERALLPAIYWLTNATCQLLPSPQSRRVYASRITSFLTWLERTGLEFGRESVEQWIGEQYKAGKGRSSINQSIAALKKLAETAAAYKAITADCALGIQQVRVKPASRVRLGNWLSPEQAARLVKLPDTRTTAGKRDALLLGLLVGCGLRREEAAALNWGKCQHRQGRAVLVDVDGKGGKLRTIVLPVWVSSRLEAWRVVVGSAATENSKVLRAVTNDGRVSTGLSSAGVWYTVKRYAEALGVPELAPHDLRRTFAKLSKAGGAKLDQIQVALGHSSVGTTERYLATALDFTDPACDHLGLAIEAMAFPESRER